jgi:hypothetical protein
MNEGIQLPVLQFETKGKGIILTDLMDLSDDAQPVFQVAHVIISHFKNEEGFDFF